jgi:mannosyltransferase OCH1-like enzyme
VLFRLVSVLFAIWAFDWSKVPVIVNRDLLLQKNATNLVIPAIIHQTIKKESMLETMSKDWKDAYQSCRDKYPDYQYFLWTDENAREFIKKEFPEFLEVYDSYPYDIQRADAVRYFALYKYGGIYHDLDIGCERDWEILRDRAAIFPETSPFGVSNDLMMSRKSHPLLKKMCENLSNFNKIFGTKYLTVMFSTGPVFVDAQIIEFMREQKYTRNEADLLYMLGGILYGGNQESFVFHVDGSTWHGDDVRVLQYLYSHYLFILSILIAVIPITFIYLKRHKRKTK